MTKRDTDVAKRNARRLSLYQQVFGSPEGLEVLYDMMSTHYVLNSTFDGDARKCIFREGERNAILRILSILKLDVKAIHERIRLHETSVE